TKKKGEKPAALRLVGSEPAAGAAGGQQAPAGRGARRRRPAAGPAASPPPAPAPEPPAAPPHPPAPRARPPADERPHPHRQTDAEPDVPLTVWSQGESITNRYWIPCLDRPNQRQTTELYVTVAEGNEVLSNGSLVERTKNTADKTETFHWLQDKPHPSYLVTL